MKIYTRTGDKGQTSLFGGARVSKAHIRVETYGTLDELNSSLGLCISLARHVEKKQKKNIAWLVPVQRDLFALGSWLASPEASKRVAQGKSAFPGAREAKTQIDLSRVAELETYIDNWEKKLKPMKTFILPGGSLTGAQVHQARTLCRKAEREVVALRESGEVVPEIAIIYLNRLADALFVFARFVNHKAKMKEDPWV